MLAILDNCKRDYDILYIVTNDNNNDNNFNYNLKFLYKEKNQI